MGLHEESVSLALKVSTCSTRNDYTLCDEVVILMYVFVNLGGGVYTFLLIILSLQKTNRMYTTTCTTANL